MDALKIILVQYDISWEDKGSNFSRIEKLLKENGESKDIIVLPEMFSTGFTMNPQKVAEEDGGETLEWMKDLAISHQAAVCGSMVIRSEDIFLNRFYFVDPVGRINKYDKKHLFSYGKESDHYTAGEDRVSFKYKGWKIVPFICYDLRFPVWMRNFEEADLYIVVANWPDTRIDAWDTLLRARAIENQVFVAAVNRVGVQPGGLQYNGHSAILGFDGKIMEFNANEEALIQGKLDKKELQEFRNEFRFLADRDPFRLLP